ncbi:hypothetical protein FA95DRAFT_1505108, partial [Auriscalpium vulgare]
TLQSQSDYIEEWVSRKPLFLKAFYDKEARPEPSLCSGCALPEATWRCRDCLRQPLFCRSCCNKGHALQPFHRVQQWNGNSWADGWLRSTGVALHLGHGGKLCPSAEYVRATPMDEDDENGPLPKPAHLSYSKGAVDEHGNRLITVVHINGVHQIGVAWCHCPSAQQRDLQLMDIGLFPASYKQPQTAFTMEVLEGFTLDVLECKTTASQYYSKLRRATSKEFPYAVPDRYRELLRVSRAYRDLKALQSQGFGFDDSKPGPGDLAVFCPRCPQAGINLPQDWRQRPDADLVVRTFLMDGNFTAEHMKMRRPENDVALRDGLGFFVRRQPYQRHLAASVEAKPPKSTCHNHRAHEKANGNSMRHDLEATGIGATACLHGCLIPHSVVDFQKGERQMNMDYSLTQAVSYKMGDIPVAIVSYDINCQYMVNFLRRISDSKFMSFPKGVDIRAVIPLWHIHAHQKKCLAQFSPSFMTLCRQLCGEVIETLWSYLNDLSSSARGSTTSGRQEILDDAMNNSNWMKLVRTVVTICQEAKAAVAGMAESREAFRRMDANLSRQQSEHYLSIYNAAMERRKADVTAMDVFDVQADKAPGKALILADMAEAEVAEGDAPGLAAWLSQGLKIQETQLSVAWHVKKLGKKPTADARYKVAQSRSQLLSAINTFQESSAKYISALADIEDDDDLASGWVPIRGPELDDGSDDEDGLPAAGLAAWEACRDDADPDAEVVPENLPISLPSTLGAELCCRYGLLGLQRKELQLRIGQANDALHQIRLAIGHKAHHFQNDVRAANTTRTKTRAWAKVLRIETTVKHNARIYRRTRHAILQLDPEASLSSRYQALKDEDLKVDTAALSSEARGQRNKQLAWFWAVDAQEQMADDGWMGEFYRVHWLRAKAQLDRWREEIRGLTLDMDLTEGYFAAMESKWKGKVVLARETQLAGHEAHAWGQVHMWQMFGQHAAEHFELPRRELAKVDLS